MDTPPPAPAPVRTGDADRQPCTALATVVLLVAVASLLAVVLVSDAGPAAVSPDESARRDRTAVLANAAVATVVPPEVTERPAGSTRLATPNGATAPSDRRSGPLPVPPFDPSVAAEHRRLFRAADPAAAQRAASSLRDTAVTDGFTVVSDFPGPRPEAPRALLARGTQQLAVRVLPTREGATGGAFVTTELVDEPETAAEPLFVPDAAPAGRSDRRDGGVRILILGDSYAAGVGGGTMYAEQCLRTNGAWGELLGRRIRSELNVPVEVVNRACDGARTRSYWVQRRIASTEVRVDEPPAVSASRDADAACRDKFAPDRPQDGYVTKGRWRPTTQSTDRSDRQPSLVECVQVQPPQRESVDDSFDLVVFTFGGNDAQFSAIGRRCLTPEVPGASAYAFDRDACAALLHEAELLVAPSTEDGETAPPLRRVGDREVFDRLAWEHDWSLERRYRAVLTDVERRLNPPGRTQPGRVVLLPYPSLLANADYENDGLAVGPRLQQVQDRGDEVLARVQTSFSRPLDGPCPTAGGDSVVVADTVKQRFAGRGQLAPIDVSLVRSLERDAEAELTAVPGYRSRAWLWGLRTPVSEVLHPKPAGYEAMTAAAYEALGDGCGSGSG